MKRLLYITLFLLVPFIIKAQDPQFSQFYNTSLMVNPAFTGSTECYRAGIAARTQWTGLKRAFNTTLIYADFNYEDYNSGIGIMALYDQSGVAALNNIELSGLYSYQVQHNEYNLKLGLQATYVQRNIDYSRIIFEDQFNTDLDIFKPITDDPVSENGHISYADFSTGLLFYKSNTYWLGFAMHHLSRPEQGFLPKDSRLPIRYSLQLGYKFEHEIKSMSKTDYIKVYPVAFYKAQAKFDQIDLGIYTYYNSFMLGVFYRGVYVKEFENERSNDSFAFHMGYNHKHWSVVYSYDFTTSQIRQANTHGSHEISLVRKFCMDLPRQKKMHRSNRSLPCPTFTNEKFTKGRKIQRNHKAIRKKSSAPKHKKVGY